MATYMAKSKMSAKMKAKRMRAKGYNASVYDMKGRGYGVSVTRKKK